MAPYWLPMTAQSPSGGLATRESEHRVGGVPPPRRVRHTEVARYVRIRIDEGGAGRDCETVQKVALGDIRFQAQFPFALFFPPSGSGAFGSRFVGGEGFLDGAVRLVDSDIGVGMTVRIGIRNGDTAERLSANHTRPLRLGPIDRLQKLVVFVGVAVRPAVDGDGLNVFGRVEPASAQHAA